MMDVTINREMLQNAIAARLEQLWNRADSDPDSKEYDAIVDEVVKWHGFVRDNSLQLPTELVARF